jgi:hypothetical protein
MRIYEHQKKGCDKVVDFEKNFFKLKLYPLLRNATESLHLVKDGHILEYRGKTNAFPKPRHNHLSSTLALKGVQIFEHKRKKEKMFPLDICEEVLEEFVVIHKK